MKKNQVIVSELMSLCAILIVAIIMVSYSAKSNKREVAIVKVENLRNAVINGSVNEIKKPTIDNGLKGFEVYFPLSDNSITYIFDITNKGKIDAKISELSISSPICKQNNKVIDCNGISYTLFYTDTGYKVSYDNTIKAGETKTVVLFIKTSVNDVTVSNLNLKLLYK